MPKLKTYKALAKKVKVTAGRKVLRRATGQNHYNAKDTGNEVRSKRGDVRVPRAEEKHILRALGR